MWTDTFEYKRYPAQMLKVTGDFCRASGAFENPDNNNKNNNNNNNNLVLPMGFSDLINTLSTWKSKTQ